MKKNRSRKKQLWPRTASQVFFFVLIALIAINHAMDGTVIPLLSNTSLHAVCPFGGVVSIYQFATVGTFTQKIHESSFILMILMFILSFIFGSVFCGWVYPLGSVQEWVGKLGKWLFKKRYNQFIPRQIDQYLRYLRYIMLAWVLYMTATSGKLAFGDIDPYYALFNFWTGEVAITGLAVLGITLLSALAIERPWCKYACPYGAVLGIINLFSIFSIRRRESQCTSCNLCSKECPMNIPVHALGVVRDHQCIVCLECTSEANYPVENTVTFSTRGDR